jgi:hypothetical protein
MMLEPALGRNGFWTRLKRLAVPALFVWGERDRLVSASFAHQVALTRPEIPQLLLPCVSHWINGPHHRCLAEAMAVVVEELRATKRREGEALDRVRIGAAELEIRACIAHGAAPRQRPACFTTGSENV